MRHILKSLWTAFRAVLVIFMLWICFAPASVEERVAIGPEGTSFDLTQMRLARAMMSVAPEFTVARYAQATGLPPDVIRRFLEERATGEADALMASAPAAARRTEAGSALFVLAD